MHEIYQQHILAHARSNAHRGALSHATHVGRSQNASCGDDLTLRLRIENESIAEASFEGIGCAISQAAASLLTETLTNMPIAEAAQLTERDVDHLLGFTVSGGREKCAYLVLAALHKALDSHENA